MDTLRETEIEDFILAPEQDAPCTAQGDELTPMEAVCAEEAPADVPTEECAAPEEENGQAPQNAEDKGGDANAGLCARLEELSEKMDSLNAAFDGKLRYDASKQVIIDRQYAELEMLRRAEFEKLSNAIIMDVIEEIDGAEKSSRYFAPLECSPENFAKLKKLLLSTSDDLVDLLERNDVFAYRSEPGSAFNPKRQRVLRVVQTDDPAADKTIAESLRAGFERESRVLRPELVSVCALRKDVPTA